MAESEKEWFIRDECGDLSDPMSLIDLMGRISEMEDGECLGEVECYDKVDIPVRPPPAPIPCNEEPEGEE